MATTETSDGNTIKVLGLHGSGGTATAFRSLLETWSDALDGIQFQIETVQGEVPKDYGYAWWKLGPGERSSTANSYDGYLTSESAVLGKSKDCDLIIAHSQGAILMTALYALGKIGKETNPSCILNGVAWPNPYTSQLESLKVSGRPRILLIVGVKDRINEPEQAFRVEQALQKAGCEVSVVLHPGGHAVPMPRPWEEETWAKIEAWIKAGIEAQRAETSPSGKL